MARKNLVRVPGTPQIGAAVPAGQAPQRPPKQTIYRPIGAGLKRQGDIFVLTALVSPFEVIQVELSNELREDFIEALTGVAVVGPNGSPL